VEEEEEGFDDVGWEVGREEEDRREGEESSVRTRRR
jgi:hypothetical protein